MNREYWKAILILVIFIFFVCPPQASTLELEDAKILLEKANYALQKKDFLEALKCSDKAFQVAKDNELKAEALYLYGKIAEKVSNFLTDLAWKEVKPRQSGYWDEDFISWEGLKAYEEIGLKFEYSHLGQVYYYKGDSYRKIVQNFPKTSWACPASYKLVLLEEPAEWGGYPEGPKEEIAKIERLFEKCSQPEVKSEILLKIAKDYLYIVECYDDNRSQFFDPDRAQLYKQKAEETIKRITEEYPNSEEAKKVKYELYRLKKDKK